MGVQWHSLFQPIQANGRVSAQPYREWRPSPALLPYISCYWASEPLSDAAMSFGVNATAIDRVIPDGCTDILFEQDLKEPGYRVRFCGMFDSPFPIVYDTARPVRKLGVRFLPGGAHVFLKASLSEFTNRDNSLEAIELGAARELGDRVFAEPSVEARIQVIEQYLIGLLPTRGCPEDHRMNNMLYQILDTRGNVSVAALAESECISPRQLHRKFNQWIGMGPKRFSEIVRFQAVVGDIRHKQHHDWTTLALRHGFFDQAHLNHEFKRFYGATPSAAAEEYRSMSVLYNT